MNDSDNQWAVSSTAAPEVALVEDDPQLREGICLHLNHNGFKVSAVNSASALNDLLTRQSFTLYVLDVNLPGENGISIATRLRQAQPKAGIVIMTARTGLTDKIAAYKQGGADFYLTKPVMPDELVLVLQGLANRIGHKNIENSWLLRLRERSLQTPDGAEKLRLTSKEKSLLMALAQAKDNTLSSGDLCDMFSDNDGNGAPMSKHALEELITRLRRKFKLLTTGNYDGAVQSVWGVGYQLCIPVVLED